MSQKYVNYGVLALRVGQLLCIGFVITGFIWASSDLLLLSVLVDVPVTPISVLLMLYGTLGTGLIELLVRLLSKKKQ